MLMARHRQSEIKDAHWLEDLETTVFNLGGGSPLAKRSAISVTPLRTFFRSVWELDPVEADVDSVGRSGCLRSAKQQLRSSFARYSSPDAEQGPPADNGRLLHLQARPGPHVQHEPATKPSAANEALIVVLRDPPLLLEGASPRVCRVLAQTAGRLLGCMSTTEPPSIRSP
jgi:hypothetical protein